MIKEAPIVSIITPAHNAEKHLLSTIHSVQKQTYTNWEMIIVNDRSTDGTAVVALQAEKKDGRIIYTENNSGLHGPGPTRNVGISKARGRFIAFLDSDDLWEKDKLDTQLNDFKLHNHSISYTSYKMIDEQGREKSGVVQVPTTTTYKNLLKQNIIGCLTVMIDTQKAPKISMKNERHEDCILWLSLLKKGHEARGIQRPLAFYRKHSVSISSNKLKAASWVWRIFREEERLNLIQSLWYFTHYAFYSIVKHFL